MVFWLSAQARGNFLLALYLQSRRSPRQLLMKGGMELLFTGPLVMAPVALFARLATVPETPPHWPGVLVVAVVAIAALWWRAPRAGSVRRKLAGGFVRSLERLPASSPEVGNALTYLENAMIRQRPAETQRQLRHLRRSLRSALYGRQPLSSFGLFAVVEELDRLCASAPTLSSAPAPET